MAKSKIIKDLANGVVDTQTALKRTKVLLQDLGDEKLLAWVNCEISGYPEDVEVPEYRVIQGQTYGTYVVGTMSSHVKYSEVPLPLGSMPEKMRKELTEYSERTSVGALKEVLDSDKNNNGLVRMIPAELYPGIAKFNNSPNMAIVNAYVKMNMSKIRNIFPQVESKLLDVLTYLEKKFGNLDELDIDTETKTSEELQEIISHLTVVIYDNSVNIGDNNKIRNSTIASENLTQ